jgi:hypothetical protein
VKYLSPQGINKPIVLFGSYYLSTLTSFAVLCMLFPKIGKRYDLEFQSPQKSGQDFKSAEDLMELYKELCVGKSVYLTPFQLMLL